MIRPEIRAAALAVALVPLSYIESAHAAPTPKNDDIADAIVITEPSFSAKLNTAEATTGPDDPFCAGNSATVWYVYTAEVDERIHVDTFGSTYDTTLSVYTEESSEPLFQVACDDDARGLQSAIDFQATAATTYYFMVGAFSGSSGGATRFNFEVNPPLDISLQFDPVSLNGTGEATLDITVLCSRPATVDISGLLTQKSKGVTRTASFEAFDIECEYEAFTSVGPLTPDSGTFAVGNAAVDYLAAGTALDDGETGEFPGSQKFKLAN